MTVSCNAPTFNGPCTKPADHGGDHFASGGFLSDAERRRFLTHKVEQLEARLGTLQGELTEAKQELAELTGDSR